jgi:hypothetical protein
MLVVHDKWRGSMDRWIDVQRSLLVQVKMLLNDNGVNG